MVLVSLVSTFLLPETKGATMRTGDLSGVAALQ
jgi:hypothetical protein